MERAIIIRIAIAKHAFRFRSAAAQEQVALATKDENF